MTDTSPALQALQLRLALLTLREILHAMPADLTARVAANLGAALEAAFGQAMPTLSAEDDARLAGEVFELLRTAGKLPALTP